MWGRHCNSSSSSIHSGRLNSSSASGSGCSGVSKNGGNNNTSGSSGVEGSTGAAGSSVILGGNSYGFTASPGGVSGSFAGGSSTSNLGSFLGGTGTGSGGNRHHTGAHPPHGTSRALSSSSPLHHSHHPHPLSHAGEQHHPHHFTHSGADGSGGSGGGGNHHSTGHFSGSSSTHVKLSGHHPPVHTNHTGHTSSTPLPMGSGSSGVPVVGGSPTYNSSLSSPSGSVPGMGGAPHDRLQELCKYFMNGGCVRGVSCPFSHHVPDERHLDVNKVGFILHPNVQNAQKAVPTSVSSPSSSHNTSAIQNTVSSESGLSTAGSSTAAGVSPSSFSGFASVSPAPPGVHTSSLSSTSLSGHLGTDLTSPPIFYPAFFPPNSNTSVSGSAKGVTNATLKSNLAFRTGASDANKGSGPVVSTHTSAVITPDTAQLLSKFSDYDSLPTTITKSTPPPRYRPPEPFLEHNLPPALVLPINSRTKEMEKLFLSTLLNGNRGPVGDSSFLSTPPSPKSTGLHPSTGTGVGGSISAAALSTNSVPSVASSVHSGGVPVTESDVGNGSGNVAPLKSNGSSTVTSNNSGSVSFSPSSSLLTVGGTGTKLSSSPHQQHSYYAALTGGLGLKKGSFTGSVEHQLPSSPQSTTLVGVGLLSSLSSSASPLGTPAS